ncbi:MAG: response regulator [Chloracidobacterium sp.]|nr:response regulator [Chloracidobacterium sp.]
MSNGIHICNSGASGPSGWEIVDTDAKLQDGPVPPDSFWLVNIHLNWGGRFLSSDYGFDVANIIRTKLKSTAPIIFYSPIKASYFERRSEKKLKYKILFGRGSGFIESPFTQSDLDEVIKNTPPLTPSALHDVVTMLADVKGMVLDKLNHNLKFGNDPLPYFNEVEPFLSQIQKTLVEFDNYRDKLVKARSENNETEFREIKEAFLGLCAASLTEQGQSAAPMTAKKHKILLVEDNENQLKEAVDFLNKSFEVVAESDAQNAIDILDADTGNEILAVICDWRLYKDGSEYWQKYQGYEILDHASKNGFRALFALTSQADFVVHQIRNATDFRFQLVKKQNVENDQQKALFADMIATGCADALTILSERPNSASWTNEDNGVSYQKLYLQTKHSLEAAAFFASVASKADEVWAYVTEQSKNNYRDITDIRDRFGLKMSKKHKQLFPVLVLRLVWFAMWTTLSDTERDDTRVFVRMYKILCTGNYSGTTIEYHKNNANQEVSRMCLTREDVQGGVMLPHERAWLLKHGLLK